MNHFCMTSAIASCTFSLSELEISKRKPPCEALQKCNTMRQVQKHKVFPICGQALFFWWINSYSKLAKSYWRQAMHSCQEQAAKHVGWILPMRHTVRSLTQLHSYLSEHCQVHQIERPTIEKQSGLSILTFATSYNPVGHRRSVVSGIIAGSARRTSLRVQPRPPRTNSPWLGEGHCDPKRRDSDVDILRFKYIPNSILRINT